MVRYTTPAIAMSAAVKHMDGPFAWGVADCCVSACAAFNELWSVNPMGDHGYRDAAGARATLASAGGWRRYTRNLANRAGLVETNPVPGAIGLVMTRKGYALGLCVGQEWAVKGVRGVSFVSDWRLAWGVKCPA